MKRTTILLLLMLPAAAQDSFGVRVEAGPKLVSRPPLLVKDVADPGTVEAKLAIDAQGSVTAVRSVQGPADLRSAVSAAAAGWKFSPAQRPYVERIRVTWTPLISSASGPKRVRAEESAQRRLQTLRVTPRYPAEAKAARLTGTVRLLVLIGTNGAVADVQVLAGHPVLVEATEAAVRQWRYQPLVLNGEPVEVVTTVEIPFGIASG